MKVTRDDVARAAGVSTAVVSYVLNDGPRAVSEERRARVLNAVAELGYRPDGIARVLRSGRSNIIGVLLPDVQNPFFAELAVALERASFERGFGVVLGNSDGSDDRERTYLESLAERRVAGIVLASVSGEQDFEELRRLGIPVVAVDRLRPNSHVSTVHVDNNSATRLAVEHLAGHGRTRHAIISGPAGSAVAAERVAGWSAALVTADLQVGPVVNAAFDYEGGYRAAREILASGTRTDAVVVGSDVQAIGFLRALAEASVGVPDEIAVVSLDGTTAARYTVPSLTAVAQPIESMAQRAIAELLDSGAEPQVSSLPPTLVLGESCGCR